MMNWVFKKKKEKVPVRNIRICSDKMWLRALTFMKCSGEKNVDIKASHLGGLC